MNDKVAKRLRAMAKIFAKGMPQKEYLIDTLTGMIINSPQSERGIYRHLKRNRKYGNHASGTKAAPSG